jgi:hypothetical protein
MHCPLSFTFFLSFADIHLIDDGIPCQNMALNRQIFSVPYYPADCLVVTWNKPFFICIEKKKKALKTY